MKLQVQPTTRLHLQRFTANPIRPEDVDEWIAATGKHPKDILMANNGQDYANSAGRYGRAIVDREDHSRVLALWGCHKLVTGGVVAGVVWLIGADLGAIVAGYVHREFNTTEWAPIKRLYPLLTCGSQDKQLVHHKWLRKAGFQKTGEYVMGTGQFFVFTRARTLLDV